jgi:glycosyltransferase involved in cell wall biosynthesis
MAPFLKHVSSGEKPASVIPLVDISVGSRFHAFDLARELNLHRMLHSLHTGYPAFTASRFGLPSNVIRSVWSHEPLNRFSSLLHRKNIFQNRPDFLLSDRFDRIVARRLRPGANLFVGWSSQCLRSLEKAATYGMVTIVERGSAHIQWQRVILQAEAERSGLPAEIPDSRTVERELAEYETAGFIAVPSRFVAKTFLDRGIKGERLIVNPYGVDLERFGMGRPHKSQCGLHVIHVGQVSVRKGVRYLVAAVEKVKGATLTLVGAIHPGMEPIVTRSCTRIVGPVPGAQLPSFYAAADVFCLLSIEEGLALVILQAMAMGLPVIATRNTGVEEIITDGVEGFIVEARDSSTVAERLQWLADHEDQRLEMGLRARAKVAEGFSWADYGARARSAYQSILLARNTYGVQ